ncbi:MAG: AAA family ATPase, partial [Nitrospinae bacterium]|nr:AAA family ATPase [Nitrospinota bacterium]
MGTMILKSLELTGFKSFVDHTRLEFNNGLTAIVGPNGCGKSNVSDAIRWVIGEQSSKTLRGTRTTDLIFNGSGSRKPVNRTEITLTLGNVPTGIRVASVPNLGEEIKVTRCYHRSGESEFYINQIPCRLKDITDLFLDVGISPKALSVIEQTHIHNIISSKPEDRRFLLEEAAGILKFKHRKLEALRKLEVSSQNLARIGDIVQELGRQVESLKRQAAKADRYKKYQAEVKELSLNLFAKKLRGYREQLEEIEKECARQAELKAELSAQGSELENRIAQSKLEIDELSSALYRKKEAVHDLSTQINKNEHAIELKRHQTRQAEEDIGSADAEIRKMNEETGTLLAEKEDRRKELGKASEEINAQEELCAAHAQAIQADQEALRYQEESARLGEKQVMGLYQQMSQKKNELTALETRKLYLETRESKQRRELEETEKTLEQTRASLTQTEQEQEGRVREFEASKKEKEDLQGQADLCRKDLKDGSARLGFAKETYLKQSSLLNSLRELRSKFEGFEDGVKSLMTHNANGNRMNGLRE